MQTTDPAIPIVEIDIVGFTSRYKNENEQREIVRALRKLIDQAGKYLLPHGQFSEKFKHQGTGDGYYIRLGGTPVLPALQFVRKLMGELDGYNEKYGENLPLQLRLVIGLGQVQDIEDQWYGTVLADAERLMSDKGFKEYQERSGRNSALFITNLFFQRLLEAVESDTEFMDLHTLVWSRREVEDKHEQIHIGYVLGEGDEIWPPEKSDEKAQPDDAPERPIEPARRQEFKPEHYDVFLCHNSADKPAVKEIGKRLKEHGLRPWLDEWHLRPGFSGQAELEKQIENIKAAAVFVGESGMGPWQTHEYEAFFREFIARKCPVIPVILPECKGKPDLPVFLKGMTWVDFTKTDPDPLGRLIWGITGENPNEPTSTIPQNLPGRGSQHFVGRAADLADLHELLQAGEKAAIRAAIKGMGGVGKTELALQYARDYQAWYPGGLCWVNAGAGDEEIQFIQYVETYQGITIPPTLEGEHRLRYISERLPEEQALLILDDYAGKYPAYLKRLPENYRILITTRENPRGFRSVSLDVLEPGAARELLGELIGDKKRIATQGEDTRALCDWLGHLPLAIELVGSYLGDLPDLSIQQILAELKERGIGHEALELDENDPANQGQSLRTAKHTSVYAALELSRERLSENGLELALLLAQLGPAIIPVRLMEEIYKRYQEEKSGAGDFTKARGELNRLSLLEHTEGRGYRLHPLVREYFQLYLRKTETADKIQEAVVYILVREAERVGQSLTLSRAEIIKDIVPHWEWACEVLTDVLAEDDLTRPFVALVFYYRFYSDFSQAIKNCQSCLAVSERILGPEHPETARSLNNLAFLYNSQGQYADALPLYERALEIREAQLGPEHPDTAGSLNNLASLYESQGQYAAALPLYERALEINKVQLGPEHPETARSLNNLANLYESQGQYADALPLYKRALAITEAQLGPEHPETAGSLNNLAFLYNSQGQYADALPLYKRALEIREAQLGPEHPDTAGSLNNLAFFYNSQGQYAAALPLYERALKIFETVLGPEHPNTVTVRKNLEKCKGTR